MLRKASDLKGFHLAARDGTIGRVKDFYFDDEHWAVRYLVADTGSWLTGRRVLISPAALGQVHEPPYKLLDVHLTKQQIEDSPPIEEHQPVSRQHEVQYWRHYGWPMYWQGPMLWGADPYPGPYMVPPTRSPEAEANQEHYPEGDPHLRSVNEVTGYYCAAQDGEIGHVEDFILDDHDWAVRYLVVDTRNWWPGKKVLLPPAWISSVEWERSQVRVDVQRHTIQGAPDYDTNTPVTREYEERLYEHYSREAYWRHSREAVIR